MWECICALGCTWGKVKDKGVKLRGGCKIKKWGRMLEKVVCSACALKTLNQLLTNHGHTEFPRDLQLSITLLTCFLRKLTFFHAFFAA